MIPNTHDRQHPRGSIAECCCPCFGPPWQVLRDAALRCDQAWLSPSGLGHTAKRDAQDGDCPASALQLPTHITQDQQLVPRGAPALLDRMGSPGALNTAHPRGPEQAQGPVLPSPNSAAAGAQAGPCSAASALCAVPPGLIESCGWKLNPIE